jgi:hypothetical protein
MDREVKAERVIKSISACGFPTYEHLTHAIGNFFGIEMLAPFVFREPRRREKPFLAVVF